MLVVIDLVCGNAHTRVNINEDSMMSDIQNATLTLLHTAQQLVPGKKVQRLVYYDDEGDACTLAPETLEDAITQAELQVPDDNGMNIKLLRLQGVVTADEVEAPKAEPAGQASLAAAEPTVADPALRAPQVVHHGVTCDRCGVNPIIGTRHKKRDANYDLCEADFQLLPEAGRKQYIHMDQPQCHQQGPQPRQALDELNRRFGWDEATVESVKESSFGAGMHGLQKMLSPKKFDEVAAAVEQIFGVPQDRLSGCLEEMNAIMPALLVTENPLMNIQAAVADIVAKAKSGRASPVPSDLDVELDLDACKAALRSLLNHPNAQVSAAAADAVEKATLAPTTPPCSTHPAAGTLQQEEGAEPATVPLAPPVPVHTHVECDMCGMHPIVGVRYKRRWVDYDLCEADFNALPEDTREQFVRIEKPMCPRSVVQLEADGRAHFGITCDATNVEPIIGARFKKLGEDYDLCEAAFEELPEEQRSLFVRIERPEDAHAVIAQAEAERAAAQQENANTCSQYADLPKWLDDTSLEAVMKRLQKSVSQEQVQFALESLKPVFRLPEVVQRVAFEAVEARMMDSFDLVEDAVAVTFLPDIVQDILVQVSTFTEPELEGEAAAAATTASEAEAAAADAAQEDARSEGEISYAMPPSETSSGNRWELVEPEKADAQVEAPAPVETRAAEEPVVFHPAPRVERPTLSAAAVSCTIAVGNHDAMAEDPNGRGDVTSEYRDLIQQYPNVTQVFCMGRVMIQRGATSTFEAKAFVRNTGGHAWPAHSSINIVAGPHLGFAQLSLGAVPAGDTAEVVFDLNIEQRENREVLQSFWCMSDNHGEPFGPLLMLQTVVM